MPNCHTHDFPLVKGIMSRYNRDPDFEGICIMCVWKEDFGVEWPARKGYTREEENARV